MGRLHWCNIFRLLGYKMTSHQISGYIIIFSGSLLFIFVGSMLCFAPVKFSEFMRWWAKQIQFPQRSSYDVVYETSLRKRLPGLFLLCFGGLLLFITSRSLIREMQPLNLTTHTLPLERQNPSWVQYVSSLFPIAFGIFILIRTDAIVDKFSHVSSGHPAHADGLTQMRRLFKVIGFAAVIAGLYAFTRLLPMP